MWIVWIWIVLIVTILLIVDVTDIKLNIVDRQDSAAVCLSREGGGGEQDSADCKTMWLVGEDPLGLGCDVDSVAGYIQSYCNVLENVDYCVDSVDYCVDTVDIAAVRVAGKEGGEQRASGFSIGLSTVLRYYLVPRRVT